MFSIFKCFITIISLTPFGFLEDVSKLRWSSQNFWCFLYIYGLSLSLSVTSNGTIAHQLPKHLSHHWMCCTPHHQIFNRFCKACSTSKILPDFVYFSFCNLLLCLWVFHVSPKFFYSLFFWLYSALLQIFLHLIAKAFFTAYVSLSHLNS